MAITSPSEYLKAARRECSKLPAVAADEMLDMCLKAVGGCHELAISPAVPVKYHARMQKVWAIVAFNILFANATHNVSLARRHQMLQNSLITER